MAMNTFEGEGAGLGRNGAPLSDVAYTRILEILFERRLPAGAFVSQNELVEMTGVPVAPLRDALRVLRPTALSPFIRAPGSSSSNPAWS